MTVEEFSEACEVFKAWLRTYPLTPIEPTDEELGF